MYLAQQTWSLKRGHPLTCVHWELQRASYFLPFGWRWTLFSLLRHISHPENASRNVPAPSTRVASDDHTRINTSARLTAGTARLRDVFSRSQIVPLHFITVWSLLCRRLLPGCNWEQMRRPVRASVVMSARVEGKAQRDWGRKWSRSDGGLNGPLERLWGSLQVCRWAEQRSSRNTPKRTRMQTFNCLVTLVFRAENMHLIKKKKKKGNLLHFFFSKHLLNLKWLLRF